MKKSLDLYITKACNLHCDYCFVDLEDSLSQKFDIEKFLTTYKPDAYYEVKFLWWEPLLLWNDIVSLISRFQTLSPNITFTIITNGTLLDAQKLQYIQKNNVNILLSVHKKWYQMVFKHLPLFAPFRKKITFWFIFESKDISFPFTCISKLFSLWFTRFSLSPEIYSDWWTENISLLEQELDKFLNLKRQFPKLSLLWIHPYSLKIPLQWCEKDVIDITGQISFCNRFKSLKTFPEHNYQKIYQLYDRVIWLTQNPNKWFYSCPVWNYFDIQEGKGNDTYSLEERIQMYDAVNWLFVRFFRKNNGIDKIWNYLSENISEVRFNLTSQCNLRCNYCYVDFKNVSLDIQAAKNIIDFYLLQPWESKIISFFWWEPLLEFSKLQTLVWYAIEKAKNLQKNLSFKMATNFTLVNDSVIAFFQEYHIELHISLNGDISTNDSMRDNSTRLVLSHLKKYQQQLLWLRVVILLAFSPAEVSLLFSNVIFVSQLWFKEINLEMIFWKEYDWNQKAFDELYIQLVRISQLKEVSIVHKRDSSVVLDVWVDWDCAEQSFSFHNYSVDFQAKKTFDTYKQELFWNTKN